MAQADTEIRPPFLGLSRAHCARHDLRDGTRARVRDRGRLLHDAQPASRCSLRAVRDCSRSYVIAAVAAQPWFTRTVAALKPAVSGQTDVSAWAKTVRQCLVDPITVVQDYAPLLATASGRVVVLLACELSAPSPVRVPQFPRTAGDQLGMGSAHLVTLESAAQFLRQQLSSLEIRVATVSTGPFARTSRPFAPTGGDARYGFSQCPS